MIVAASEAISSKITGFRTTLRLPFCPSLLHPDAPGLAYEHNTYYEIVSLDRDAGNVKIFGNVVGKKLTAPGKKVANLLNTWITQA